MRAYETFEVKLSGVLSPVWDAPKDRLVPHTKANISNFSWRHSFLNFTENQRLCLVVPELEGKLSCERASLKPPVQVHRQESLSLMKKVAQRMQKSKRKSLIPFSSIFSSHAKCPSGFFQFFQGMHALSLRKSENSVQFSFCLKVLALSLEHNNFCHKVMALLTKFNKL